MGVDTFPQMHFALLVVLARVFDTRSGKFLHVGPPYIQA